jgi:dihydroorotase|tara:strand:+ start:658 stop:1914 length:1257 start_codon:yes stop_codon:yes gene_type:complete
MNILIKNATIVEESNPSIHLKRVDIAIKDGVIIKIGPKIKDFKANQTVAINNLHVSAGWLDTGISVGEPGYESRETFQNGVLTAAKSGFSTVFLNTNTDPVPDQQNAIGYIRNAASNAPINVYPLGTLTKSAKGEDLAELYDMQRQGAVGFYDYNAPIDNPNLLKIALQYTQSFDGLVFSFPKTSKISNSGLAHEGVVATQMGLKTDPSLSEHLQIQRDIHLLRYSGGKLHIPTISSKESVLLIKAAKKEGLDISCSVSLHHIYANENALNDFNTNAKVAPPLRSKEDQKALQKALLEGSIDFMTTDHNPLDIELKNLAFDHAHYGSLGLEAAFGVLNSLYTTAQAIEILQRGYNRFKLEKPTISVGNKAVLSLFDPSMEYTQTLEDLYATSKNSLYLGGMLKGKALGTIVNENITTI